MMDEAYSSMSMIEFDWILFNGGAKQWKYVP